ncbi:hypothetical protein DAPPUDRAFT_247231 [Daphnia pulex]|uniref:Uncharacterized protein n=1 Tax=Daphnia pulex TaxID=6669 RepID=E9GS10_DAPPU|nr:hypothetical protein DAPPUDRAFT_247231 [Daphnia pulex]|eukprot:EFX77739.1 hypothetical protein DAPPUDRAFT_247231 [Daphnia pulex]
MMRDTHLSEIQIKDTERGNPKHPPPAITSLLSSCIAPALLFSRMLLAELARSSSTRQQVYRQAKETGAVFYK